VLSARRRLPPGWILSQTQPGAPLPAKSEDMIARECLVFYKIAYPSGGNEQVGRERPNFRREREQRPAGRSRFIQLARFGTPGKYRVIYRKFHAYSRYVKRRSVCTVHASRSLP